MRELLREDLDFIPDDPAELRRAVTRMAAYINHADWRFIKLIAAMDRTRGWAEAGFVSLGNWLDHRCGLGPCAARERIRLARGKPLRGPPSRSPAEGSIGRALRRLPRIDAAFRDGVLSYSKVRAVTRVATPDSEAVLLDIAGGSSAAQLESLVRTHERIGGDERERVRSETRRSLNWYYEDGMVVVTAAVPAERGALVIQALKKVVDARKDEREAYYEALLEGRAAPTLQGRKKQRTFPTMFPRKRNYRSRTRANTNRSGRKRPPPVCRPDWSSNSRARSNAMPTRSSRWPSTTWRMAPASAADATKWCSPCSTTSAASASSRRGCCGP